MGVYIILKWLKVFIIVTWSSNKTQIIPTLVFNFVNQKRKSIAPSGTWFGLGLCCGRVNRNLWRDIWGIQKWWYSVLWSCKGVNLRVWKFDIFVSSSQDESNEELEPLFDYRRVQPFNTPFNAVCLDGQLPFLIYEWNWCCMCIL